MSRRKSDKGASLIDVVFWISAFCFSIVGYLAGKNNLDQEAKRNIMKFFTGK